VAGNWRKLHGVMWSSIIGYYITYYNHLYEKLAVDTFWFRLFWRYFSTSLCHHQAVFLSLKLDIVSQPLVQLRTCLMEIFTKNYFVQLHEFFMLDLRFWVLTPCRLFGAEETACFSETLVSTYKSTRRHNPEQQHRYYCC
jgi:hypothetical protein